MSSRALCAEGTHSIEIKILYYFMSAITFHGPSLAAQTNLRERNQLWATLFVMIRKSFPPKSPGNTYEKRKENEKEVGGKKDRESKKKKALRKPIKQHKEIQAVLILGVLFAFKISVLR